MREIAFSVRELVEFVCRSGSIDNRFTGFDRMQEGTRIHKKLQKEAGEGYQAEVSFRYACEYKGLKFTIGGRADGLFFVEGEPYIDEIKTTTRNVEKMTQNDQPVHWAQAKCYAYFYLLEHEEDSINIQLTYYQIETKQIRRFCMFYQKKELQAFYEGLLEAYVRFAEVQNAFEIKRNMSIKAMPFPFETYRRGQREMAITVYRAIIEEKKLFCEAPTGIGKTLSTLFPAFKAMGERKINKIFYVTAKGVSRQEVIKNFDLLQEKGLKARMVEITAKDKICFLEERQCNPEACPYARHYFDRINAVLLEILKTERHLDREKIVSIAKRHELCPFELALDYANFADLILGDYNYLFDPSASLKRFFVETEEPWVFLIDEAHNLVDRSRKMYSAEIKKAPFLDLKRKIKKSDKGFYKAISVVNNAFIDIRKSNSTHKYWVIKEPIEALNEALQYFGYAFEKWLRANKESALAEEALALYFDVRTWLNISEEYDRHYATTVVLKGSDVWVSQLCLDASKRLLQTMAFGKSSILFSATLSPMPYFIEVLGGENSTPFYQLPSPFEPEHLGIMVADTMSTRYKDREKTYDAIAEMVEAFITGQPGNYLIFFPSYAYLEAVFDMRAESFQKLEVQIQERHMTETAQKAFLEAFTEDSQTRAFGVMGGLFSEAIDLKGNRLIGVAVIGIGLPQINEERNIIRDYYQEKGLSGFDYAYRYPGMNKVLQALGRVIRDEKDRGMVLLVDDRYMQPQNRILLPNHMRHYEKVTTPEEIKEVMINFFQKNNAIF